MSNHVLSTGLILGMIVGVAATWALRRGVPAACIRSAARAVHECEWLSSTRRFATLAGIVLDVGELDGSQFDPLVVATNGSRRWSRPSGCQVLIACAVGLIGRSRVSREVRGRSVAAGSACPAFRRGGQVNFGLRDVQDGVLLSDRSTSSSGGLRTVFPGPVHRLRWCSAAGGKTMPIVDVRDVEVLETAVVRAGEPELVGEWPCPFCGQQRQLAESHSVRVRNRNGGPFERWVLMCDDCLGNAL